MSKETIEAPRTIEDVNKRRGEFAEKIKPVLTFEPVKTKLDALNSVIAELHTVAGSADVKLDDVAPKVVEIEFRIAEIKEEAREILKQAIETVTKNLTNWGKAHKDHPIDDLRTAVETKISVTSIDKALFEEVYKELAKKPETEVLKLSDEEKRGIKGILRADKITEEEFIAGLQRESAKIPEVKAQVLFAYLKDVGVLKTAEVRTGTKVYSVEHAPMDKVLECFEKGTVVKLGKKEGAEAGREKEEQEKMAEEARNLLRGAIAELRKKYPDHTTTDTKEGWVIRTLESALNESLKQKDELKRRLVRPVHIDAGDYYKQEGIPIDQEVIDVLNDAGRGAILEELRKKGFVRDYCRSHFKDKFVDVWSGRTSGTKDQERLKARVKFEADLMADDYRGKGLTDEKRLEKAEQTMRRRREVSTPPPTVATLTTEATTEKWKIPADLKTKLDELEAQQKRDEKEKERQAKERELKEKKDELVRFEREYTRLDGECDAHDALAKRLGIMGIEKPKFTQVDQTSIKDGKKGDATKAEVEEGLDAAKKRKETLESHKNALDGKIKEVVDVVAKAAAPEASPKPQERTLATRVGDILADGNGKDILVAVGGKREIELRDCAARVLEKQVDFSRLEGEIDEKEKECDKHIELAKKLGITDLKKPARAKEYSTIFRKAKRGKAKEEDFQAAIDAGNARKEAVTTFKDEVDEKIAQVVEQVMESAEAKVVPLSEVHAMALNIEKVLADEEGKKLLITVSAKEEAALKTAVDKVKEFAERLDESRLEHDAREVQTAKRKGEALGVKNKEIQDLMDPEKVKERFAQLIQEVVDLVMAGEKGWWSSKIEFQGVKKGQEGAERNLRRREESIIAKIIEQVGPGSNLPEKAKLNENQCAELYDASKRWVQEQALIETAASQRGQNLEAGTEAKAPSKTKAGLKLVGRMALTAGATVGMVSLLGPFAGLAVVGGLRAIEGVVRGKIDRDKMNAWKEKNYAKASTELRDHLSFAIADFVERKQRGPTAQSVEQYHTKFVSVLRRESAEGAPEKRLTEKEIQSRALRLALYFEQDDQTKRRHSAAIDQRAPHAQNAFHRGEESAWNWIRRQRWLPFRTRERGQSLSFDTSPRDKARAGMTGLGVSLGLSILRRIGPEGAALAAAYGGWKLGGAIADRKIGKESPERLTEQGLAHLEQAFRGLNKEALLIPEKSAAEISATIQPYVESLAKVQAQMEQLRNPIEYAKQIERWKKLYAEIMHLKALGEFERSDKFKTVKAAGTFLAADYRGFAAADRARMDTLDARNRNRRLRWKIGGALAMGAAGYLGYEYADDAMRWLRDHNPFDGGGAAVTPPAAAGGHGAVRPGGGWGRWPIPGAWPVPPGAGGGGIAPELHLTESIDADESIWGETHDFLKGHGYDQAMYQREVAAGHVPKHLDTYEKWLNQETNTTVIEWKQKGLAGGEIKDLIHEDDTLDFKKSADGKWHLEKFSETSGESADYLSDTNVTKNPALEPRAGFRMADNVKMGETTSKLDDVGRDYTLPNGRHITVFDADRDGFYEVNGKEMSADEFQKYMQEQGAYVPAGVRADIGMRMPPPERMGLGLGVPHEAVHDIQMPEPATTPTGTQLNSFAAELAEKHMQQGTDVLFRDIHGNKIDWGKPEDFVPDQGYTAKSLDALHERFGEMQKSINQMEKIVDHSPSSQQAQQMEQLKVMEQRLGSAMQELETKENALDALEKSMKAGGAKLDYTHGSDGTENIRTIKGGVTQEEVDRWHKMAPEGSEEKEYLKSMTSDYWREKAAAAAASAGAPSVEHLSPVPSLDVAEPVAGLPKFSTDPAMSGNTLSVNKLTGEIIAPAGSATEVVQTAGGPVRVVAGPHGEYGAVVYHGSIDTPKEQLDALHEAAGKLDPKDPEFARLKQAILNEEVKIKGALPSAEQTIAANAGTGKSFFESLEPVQREQVFSAMRGGMIRDSMEHFLELAKPGTGGTIAQDAQNAFDAYQQGHAAANDGLTFSSFEEYKQAVQRIFDKMPPLSAINPGKLDAAQMGDIREATTAWQQALQGAGPKDKAVFDAYESTIKAAIREAASRARVAT